MVKCVPWKMVERSRRDPDLKQYQGVRDEYLAEARYCPQFNCRPISCAGYTCGKPRSCRFDSKQHSNEKGTCSSAMLTFSRWISSVSIEDIEPVGTINRVPFCVIAENFQSAILQKVIWRKLTAPG